MQDVTLTHAGPCPGRREWLGLAVLALPTLLVTLDIGALFLALPHPPTSVPTAPNNCGSPTSADSCSPGS